MEPNNMNGIPQQTPPQPAANTAPSMPAKPASSAGTWTAIVILLAVLILGGFYFWGRRADNSNLNPGSTSDETSAIEADLNATDVNNVDYDLDPANFNAS